MTTLLVVGNDQTTVDEMLRPALPRDAYEIELVGSVDEAARVIAERAESIDAILVDWAVPEVARLDGALPDWVREHAALDDVEVIVHARTFDPGQANRLMTSGAYYFVTKPFVPSQLHGIIRAAVASCRLKRRVAQAARQMRAAASLLEEGRFEIRTPEDADALASYLGAACSDPQQGIGFLELLINAVEHGNLEISYDEKGALIDAGTFDQEVRRRLAAPAYRDRVVDVVVDAQDGQLAVEITDQGPGFDFERYLVMTSERIFHKHGKGVLLAKMCLDIQYFEPGNRVRAVART